MPLGRPWFVDWTLDHQSPEGMLGPAKNKDWWPPMVMLKALQQYHDVTQDKRVLPAMSRYFRLPTPRVAIASALRRGQVF